MVSLHIQDGTVAMTIFNCLEATPKLMNFQSTICQVSHKGPVFDQNNRTNTFCSVSKILFVLDKPDPDLYFDI